MRHRAVAAAVFCAALIAGIVVVALCMQPFPACLDPDPSSVVKTQFLARDGSPLLWTRENEWNLQQQVPLSDVPLFLIEAVIRAEDKRFFVHGGSDYRAIAAAMYQNLTRMRVVRGASTISHQVVKLLHPRPRTLWSRVLELAEARALEAQFSKQEILEFYLNQSPYPHSVRGVAGAARELFNRDLSTLSKKEMLALAVMLRAPSSLGPPGKGEPVNRRLERDITRLSSALVADGRLSEDDAAKIHGETLQFESPRLRVHATNFLRFARTQLSREGHAPAVSSTTLDPALQEHLQRLLDTRIAALAPRNVRDGAILVVDNETHEILAWVNAFDGKAQASHIDGVTTPRQPGSTLKPFLYALALERGWTAATLLDDSPLLRPVGGGLKEYRNYSGAFYGPVRLREALGNSLNVPALRTAEQLGRSALYSRLKELHFDSLQQPADYYGDGLALGNGEVTLFELTRAYSTLANAGRFFDLNAFPDSSRGERQEAQIIPVEAASLIGNMLSDPQARMLEFPSGDITDFRAQVAVKTGTSSSYYDAWALGYSSRFSVGIWLGNFEREAMIDVTGSSGPMMILKGVFAFLERSGKSRPLYFAPTLREEIICKDTGRRACNESCAVMTEWFIPGTQPEHDCSRAGGAAGRDAAVPVPAIGLPTNNLRLARDPRIPADLQRFPLQLASYDGVQKTEWLVDGAPFAVQTGANRKVLWPVSRGAHEVQARVWLARGNGAPLDLESVRIFVK